MRNVVIPLAGEGTRMRNWTSILPKHFLPLSNAERGVESMLELVLREARGVHQDPTIVCVLSPSDHLTPVVLERYPEVQIVLQREPRGLGDAILQGYSVLDPEEPCLVMLGDHMYLPRQTLVSQVVAAFLQNPSRDPLVSVGSCPPDQVHSSGILNMRGDTVTRMIEKPATLSDALRQGALQQPDGTLLCNFGVDVMTREVHRGLLSGMDLREAQGSARHLRGLRVAPCVRRLDTGTPVGYARAAAAYWSHSDTTAVAQRTTRHSFCGRVDLLGGIADNFGADVLQLPLNLGVRVEVNRRRRSSRDTGVTVSSSAFQGATVQLQDSGAPPWALMARNALQGIDGGSEVSITSTIPIGKGLASSGAFCTALVAAANPQLSGLEVCRRAQAAENKSGRTVGMMDHICAYFGEPGKALQISCRDSSVSQVRLPTSLQFWCIDVGARPEDSWKRYTRVRSGVSKALGDSLELTRLSTLFTPATLHHSTMYESASSFEKTALDFAVQESWRTKIAVLELESSRDCVGRLLGQCMYESHSQYQQLGLSTHKGDRVVEETKRHSSTLYGARITGAGCGGTVVIVGIRGSDRAVGDICAATYATLIHTD